MARKGNTHQIQKILGTTLSILGLLSLSESFVKIDEHILILIESYRFLFHPILNVLFGWIGLPPLIWDYWFIGCITISAVFATREYIPVDTLKEIKVVLYFFKYLAIALGAWFWPLAIIRYYFPRFLVKPGRTLPDGYDEGMLRAGKWCTLVFTIFIVALAINYALLLY